MSHMQKSLLLPKPHAVSSVWNTCKFGTPTHTCNMVEQVWQVLRLPRDNICVRQIRQTTNYHRHFVLRKTSNEYREVTYEMCMRPAVVSSCDSRFTTSDTDSQTQPNAEKRRLHNRAVVTDSLSQAKSIVNSKTKCVNKVNKT